MDGLDTRQALFADVWQEPYLDDHRFDPYAIVQRFEALPEIVRGAQFSRIDRRVLDHGLFTQLITQTPPPSSEVGWSSRILRREESLFPYLGKVLVCVLIRLPGVEYTVEIDPETKAIVYWEWQAIER